LKGIVIRSTGNNYTIVGEDGRKVECVLKGKFRIRGIKTTSPLAVGDRVEFEELKDNTTGVVTTIRKRDNYIIRRSTNLSKVSHIIAANIDQSLLVATLAMPRTSTGFIDRFLVTSEAYHIPSSIIFNKLDLYDKDLTEKMEELIRVYEDAEYPCFRVSATTGEGLAMLRQAMKDKVTLFAGHSGVGKSTLINALEPGLNIRIKEISLYHEKGRHATTFAEMHPLSFGGFIIDTPGIKEFGLIDFERTEVAERFPEMRRYMHECRYHNCTHTHEPGCAVKKALESGKISQWRYDNYLRIYNHEDWDNERWD
jgi:ribosome biogenesis GTPase